MKDYITKLFLIYWFRWILSAIVMLPFMLIFEYWHISLWLNLLFGQTIGAFLFFKLDKFIFSKK